MNEIDDNFEEYEAAEIRRGADFSELTADDYKSIERDDDGNVFGVNNGVPFPLSTEIRQVADNGESYDVERRQDGSEWILGRTGEKKMSVAIPRGDVQGADPGTQATGDVSQAQVAPPAVGDPQTPAMPQKTESTLGKFETFLNSPFSGITRSVAKVVGNSLGALGLLDQKQVDAFFDVMDKMSDEATKNNPAAGVVDKGTALVGQYVLPAVTGFNALRALGVGKVASSIIAESMVGFFALSPKEENLFNLISKDTDSPALKTLRDFLATDPDDNEYVNRAKNAAEALMLLGAGEAVVRGFIKTVKTTKDFLKTPEGQDVLELVEQAGARADERLAGMASGKTLSANPIGAAGDLALSAVGKVAGKLTDEEVPSLRQVLETKAKEMEDKPAARTQPSGDQMFDTSTLAYQAGVRQADQMETPVPRAPEGAKLPKKQRAALLVENMDRIAEIIADRARPSVGTNVQFFYHLGPLIKKAEELGIPADTARKQAREFAMLYGATSPRTSTEPNLRSASLVRAKDTAGLDYDEIVGPGGSGINEAGYPMMINPAKPGQAAGMHKILIDQLRETGKIDYRTNPKPATFAENVAGNLNGVTVDTHAIRGALHVLNEIAPGQIPRQWFNSDAAYKAYLDNPSDVANYAGKGIADTLAGQVVDGVKQQTEYAVFSDLYKKVAERLGVMPAEAQSLSWFANGKFTGLASPPKSIVELINDRVDVTAQALGKSKDVIFKAFMEGKIPLLSATGVLVGANLISTANQSDDAI